MKNAHMDFRVIIVLLIFVHSRASENSNGHALTVNHCATSPCKNGGTCRNGEDIYLCTCAEIYGGTTCEDIQWCEKRGKDECGDVKCINDKISKTGYCECEEYQQFNKSTKTCEEMSGCIPKLLKGECGLPHQICNDRTGQCECEANYMYNSKKGECKENFCKAVQCSPNAECKELGYGETFCVCNKGYFMYMHTNICVKGDKCSVEKCGQDCKKTKAQSCGCQTIFDFDDDNVTCNLCTKPSQYNCPIVKCVPTNDTKGYRCKCEDLYELDEDGVECKRKRMCEQRDILEECQREDAICREELTSNNGNYECVCELGFEKNDNVCKRRCDIKSYQNKCAALNALCELDEYGDVKCKCPTMLSREGKDVTKPCNIIAPNSYLAKLSVPKFLYESKETRRSNRSVENISLPKLAEDMEKSLTNVYGELNDLKILDCDDKKNVLACIVEMQLREKPKEVNAIASPTVCIPVNKEFCFVEPSLVLKREEDTKADIIQKTDPCSVEVTSRLCGKATYCSSVNDVDFQCKCRVGTYTIGYYHPVTLSTDAIIEKCSAICSPSPCFNGTCAIIGNNGFSCNCNETFTGIFCNESKKSKYINAIVGGIIGTLLVISLIAGVVVYRKRQNRKEKEDYCRQEKNPPQC